jgi:hypothetical protein
MVIATKGLHVFVVVVVGGELEAASGTGVVLLQPGKDALGVEEVFAGKLMGAVVHFELFLANGALSRPIGSEQRFSDFNHRQGLEGVL